MRNSMYCNKACSAVLFIAANLFCMGASEVEAGDLMPEIVLQTGHSREVSAVALDLQANYALTGSSDGTAILWNARTGEQLRAFKGSILTPVAINSDGKYVLAGSDDTVTSWDATTGEQRRVYKRQGGSFVCLALSADGRRILAGSVDNTAVLWDTQSGELLRTFKGHTHGVWAVALSADGRRALTGSEDKTAILWDAESGELLRTFRGHTELVKAVALSADGKSVLTGSKDKTAVLWNADSGEQVRTFKAHKSYVSIVAFSPDGKRMLTGSWDRTAMIWDAATGEQLQTLIGPHYAKSAAFSGDGKCLLVGYYDRTAILWDVSAGKPSCTFQAHTNQVTSATMSGDCKHIVTGSWDSSATLWDSTSGGPLQVFQGHTGSVNSVALSSDAKRVLTGSSDRTIILWDSASGAQIGRFSGHTDAVNGVALSADSSCALSGSNDKTAILWDTASGEQLHVLRGHNEQVRSVALSADGKRALTGGVSGETLWDATTGQRIRTFKDEHYISALALSRDGQSILAVAFDRTAVLWNATTGEKVRAFKGHTSWVWAVAFGADGKRVLSGSFDNTAKLWDVATGVCLRTFEGHTNEVGSVALSSDGKRVLTGSRDGTTRLWDADSGKELCRLISLDAGRDWLVVTPSGLFDGSPGGRQKVMYRIGGGLNVVPVDRFFQDFYRPGLLASIVKGETIKTETSFARSKPPVVRIVSPKGGGIAAQREAVLETEVVDQGGGIQGPSLFLNGARLAAEADTSKDGKTLKRSFNVSLVEGDNRFEVKAACADGSWESEPATITLRYEKPLDKPAIHVVAIGISKYAEGSYKLKYARDDAKAMAQLFEQRGKELYRQVKVTTLLDEDASREKIRATLKGVPQQAQPQDTLVLFLAGHGAMVGQRYYFIPHDFRASKEKKLEDDIRQQGLPADELADFISAGSALKRILILDTCASGGVVDLFKVKSRNSFAFRGEIERLSRSQGICFLAASSATEEAKEPEALGHGVLTYALLAGMKAVEGGPLETKPLQPTGRNQVVEVVEWFSYANGHVARLTKEYCGQEQNVQMSVQGQSFPVLPLK